MRTEEQKLATKESRRIRREQRKFRRINKRKEKDNLYMSTAIMYDRYSIGWGRRMYHGREWVCSMGYGNCEERRYCNGDC